MTTEPEDATPPYVRPRIVVGVGLFALVGLLAIWDAIQPDYMLDTVTLGLMLSTGSVILGVEPLRRFLK